MQSLGPGALTTLLYAACWGGLAGGVLHLLVQIPVVVQVLRGFRLSFSRAVPGVREALAAWGPVVAGRGVVQLAGYMDLFLASLLFAGASSAERCAQMPYLLPISLFGMSMAASELPELSRLHGQRDESELLRRVLRVLRAMAFLNVPTVIGYLCFGWLVIGALYRSGALDWRQLAGLTWSSPAMRWASWRPRPRGCCRTPSTPWREQGPGAHRGAAGGDFRPGRPAVDVRARSLPPLLLIGAKGEPCVSARSNTGRVEAGETPPSSVRRSNERAANAIRRLVSGSLTSARRSTGVGGTVLVGGRSCRHSRQRGVAGASGVFDMPAIWAGS